MQTIAQDLRFALRSLGKAYGFTAVAVLTLGLGLALCIGVLAVARAYLLRSLPYPAADRLYSVTYSAPGEEQPRQMESLDWSSLDDIIEHRIAWDLDVFYLLGGSHPQPAPGAWVTPGFAGGLGISPALGRGFVAGDFQPGAAQVALISHRLWVDRYDADESVLGAGFSAYVSDRPEEAESFTIVGVLPDGFWHLNSYTEVLAPLHAPTYPYLVRLR